MKKIGGHATDQPPPFTRGVTKALVGPRAFNSYRDKLARHGRLNVEDWVLAEKDLVSGLETQGLLTR